MTNVAVNINGSLQFDLTGAGSVATFGSSSYNTLSASNDLLEIFTTGAISLNGAVVQLAALDTTGWVAGQSWKLIDWSNAVNAGVNTTGLTLGTTSIGGFVLTQSITTDGYYVTASVVPEPSRMLLAALGVAWLAVGRRRR